MSERLQNVLLAVLVAVVVLGGTGFFTSCTVRVVQSGNNTRLEAMKIGHEPMSIKCGLESLSVMDQEVCVEWLKSRGSRE